MKLLVDTDAFCKLAVAGLFADAADLLAGGLNQCGRLPALPHMLRRGRLRHQFGGHTCDATIAVANEVPVLQQPSGAWLEKLTPIHDIDPGEALLFAAAVERDLFVLTGDRRALRALKDVEGIAEALAGRVVVLEALLVALCHHLGLDVVRQRIAPLAASDKMVGICFSSGTKNPNEALLSYYEDSKRELSPLVLWAPSTGGVM